MRRCIGQIAVILAVLATGVSSFAQAIPPKGLSQQFTYNSKHEFAGLTVRVGARSLSVQSDQRNGYLKAGDMPRLNKRQDLEGRDVSIATEAGTPIAEINVKPNGHPDKATLGNGVTYAVTPQGRGRYKESLSGVNGKPLHVRSVSPDPRRPAELVNLDPVADLLGLSADWRNEITIDAQDSLLTISNKAGKVILYVVRNGPDSVGFTPDGKPLYYDVIVFLFVGRAEVDAEYTDLAPLMPDHYIYTRNGRVGAYIRNSAVAGIHTFWTERDSSGKTLVHYSAGSTSTKDDGSPRTMSGPSASPNTEQNIGERERTSLQRKEFRPSPNATYYCETTQTCVTTQTGEESCFEPRTTCYCIDCMAGGGERVRKALPS